MVGLLSNCTHLCLAVSGVQWIDCNRQRAIAPGFSNSDFRMIILPCKNTSIRNCYPSHGSVVVVDWVDWTIFEKEEVKKNDGKVAFDRHLLMTDVVDLFKVGVTFLFSNSAHCIAGRVKVSKEDFLF